MNNADLDLALLATYVLTLPIAAVIVTIAAKIKSVRNERYKEREKVVEEYMDILWGVNK